MISIESPYHRETLQTATRSIGLRFSFQRLEYTDLLNPLLCRITISVHLIRYQMTVTYDTSLVQILLLANIDSNTGHLLQSSLTPMHDG